MISMQLTVLQGSKVAGRRIVASFVKRCMRPWKRRRNCSNYSRCCNMIAWKTAWIYSDGSETTNTYRQLIKSVFLGILICVCMYFAVFSKAVDGISDELPILDQFPPYLISSTIDIMRAYPIPVSQWPAGIHCPFAQETCKPIKHKVKLFFLTSIQRTDLPRAMLVCARAGSRQGPWHHTSVDESGRARVTL